MQWNGTSRFVFGGKSIEIETATCSELPNRGKDIAKQILAPKERNKSKRAGHWKSESGIHIEKLTIWVRSFDKMTKITSSPGLSVPLE